jgi:peptide deformylase
VAIRPIVKLGDPNDAVLRRPSSRVNPRDLQSKSMQQLIDDMFETMRDAPGVGLAAPQIGLPWRLVVVEKVHDDFPELVLVNPEIVKRSGERRVSEGCLSVPGYQGELTRAESVVVKALDRHGKEIRIKAPANSLLSQALEHEIGHLNGNLYIDNLASRDDLYRIVPAPRPRAGTAATKEADEAE